MQTKEERNRKIKELYDKRKAEGICTKCGKEKADDGSTLCFSCKIKISNRRKERYALRKAKSLCVFCNSEKPDDGHALCADCRENRKERIANNETAREKRKEYFKELRTWRKEKGICVRCGKNDAWYNHLYCPECIEKTNNESALYRASLTDQQKSEMREKRTKREQELRKYRLENNLCYNCGKPAKVGKYCLECNVKGLKRNEKERIKKRAQNTEKISKIQFKIMNGLCIRCGDPREGNHGTWCDSCAEKQAEVSRLHKPDDWIRKNNLLFMSTKQRNYVDYGIL